VLVAVAVVLSELVELVELVVAVLVVQLERTELQILVAAAVAQQATVRKQAMVEAVWCL
jgi:hypothetical protein